MTIGFDDRLLKSSDAVFAAARWLYDCGYRVEIIPLNLNDDGTPKMFDLDNGDLIATRGDVCKHLQVKRRFFAFTCADDFPYPDLMFTNAKALERAESNGVDAYICLNDDMTHAAVVMHDTKPQWFQKTQFVSNTGNEETNWHCPVSALKFYRIAANRSA